MVSNSGLDLAPILSKKLKFMTGEKNKSIVTFFLNPTSTDDGIKRRAKKSELKKKVKKFMDYDKILIFLQTSQKR